MTRLLALVVLALLPACKDRPDARAAPADAPPAGSIGVPACDDYLARMERCIGALSPEAQEPLRQNMEAARRGWRELAAEAKGKVTLETACGQALEAGEGAAGAMGCEW
jgi:hypothetical protein